MDKTDDFIDRARKKHENLYLYEELDLTDETAFVVVTCRKHGHYVVKALLHLEGEGCPICISKPSKCHIAQQTEAAEEHRNSSTVSKTDVRTSQDRKYDTKTFVRKAKLSKHGNKYCYNKVKYVNSRTAVTITCPVHGDFSQVANAHIRGFGCPACGGKEAVGNNSLKSKWPEIADEWHPTKNKPLSPDEVTYGSSKKVWWLCKEGPHAYFMAVNRRTNPRSFGSCPECGVKKVMVMSYIANCMEPLESGGLGMDLEDALNHTSSDKPNQLKTSEPSSEMFGLTYETLKHYWLNNPELRSVEFRLPSAIKLAAYKYGLEFLDAEKYDKYWLFQCKKCGDKKKIKKIQRRNLSPAAFRCEPCFLAQLKEQAEAVGLTLLGKGKNHQYRLYRFNACGHEQELVTRNVANDWFSCKTCVEWKEEQEAKDAELTLLKRRKKSKYLYRFNACNHEQEIAPSRVRKDNFKCDQCHKNTLSHEAKAVGLTFLGSGKKRGHYLYRFNACGHEQETTLKKALRRGSLETGLCKKCLQAG